MSKFQNVIKWSGSKAPLASQIVSHFPDDISVYHEPFFGSGAVLFELLTNPLWRDKRKDIIGYQCSDINKDLIDLWNGIKEEPLYLHKWYSIFWDNFNYVYKKDIGIEELYEIRKNVFNLTRQLYNTSSDWENQKYVLLLFLTRTAFNGLLRFNNKGEYNSTCHFSRPGIHPDKMEKMLVETSKILNGFHVEFKHINYIDIQPEKYDFVFLDPPYLGSNDKKMYYGAINEQELIDYCNNLPCNYALTYDGDRGENKAKRLTLNKSDIILLNGKNSSYSRMNGDKVIVNELMYVRKEVKKRFS